MVLVRWMVVLVVGSCGFAQGVGFVEEVWPILEARCVECHGPEKQKGELRVDTREGLLEGIEGWIPVVPGRVEESYLMERVRLPDGDSERMPPKGERLRDEEIALLERWIEEGARWEVPPAPRKDPARLVYEIAPLAPEEVERVEAAKGRLAELGVRVLNVAQGMEAVEVNLSLGDRAQGEVLEQVVALAPVLVRLDLARTSVGDGAMEGVGKLRELRYLNLAGSEVSDAGVAKLGGLGKLTYLNLYGTGVGDGALGVVRELSELKRVFLWQTGVTSEGVAALREARPELEVILGAELVPLPAPAVNVECPVSGAAVDGAVVVEAAGARVAFCCGNCKKVFEAEPGPYLQKLGLKAVNDVCPVSGQAAGEGFTSLFEGRRVAFCCADCKATFDAQPEAYAEKLKER